MRGVKCGEEGLGAVVDVVLFVACSVAVAVGVSAVVVALWVGAVVLVD